MKTVKTSDFGDTNISDMRALINDQTRGIASKVGDNLYSVYLKRLETGKLGPLYTDWPVKDPPVDNTFYMDEEPEQDEVQDGEKDTLVSAFNAYLRGEVYKRINKEGLEPILDYTPKVGPAGVDLALKLRSILQVERYLPDQSAALENRRRLFWTDLQIDNEKVRERMHKLFPITLNRSHDQQAYPKEARELKRMINRELRARQFENKAMPVNEGPPTLTFQDRLLMETGSQEIESQEAEESKIKVENDQGESDREVK